MFTFNKNSYKLLLVAMENIANRISLIKTITKVVVIIPDAKPPKTRQKQNLFYRFLVPFLQNFTIFFNIIFINFFIKFYS